MNVRNYVYAFKIYCTKPYVSACVTCFMCARSVSYSTYRIILQETRPIDVETSALATFLSQNGYWKQWKVQQVPKSTSSSQPSLTNLVWNHNGLHVINQTRLLRISVSCIRLSQPKLCSFFSYKERKILKPSDILPIISSFQLVWYNIKAYI